MDPGLATQLSLVSDDGPDATYLADSLRQPPAATTPPPAAPPPAVPPSGIPAPSSGLEELATLLQRGLVTQGEYDERRTAIIDSV
jgi:hypothetical protein